MTKTTAWAVVDDMGDIHIWTIKDTKANSIDEFLSNWRRRELPIGYTCIPITIKPKEDGE